MNPPLVSVICLCYNQEEFVVEAIQSVLNQTYKNIQLIVVDDYSRDRSVEVIKNFITEHPTVEFLPIPGNLGNCKAFNLGLKMSSGQFIIEKGVRSFEAAGDEFGVQFSDAECIDRQGRRIGFHSDRFPHHTIPEGHVFTEVLTRYFINSPTMMVRREVLERMEGYDEGLAYEDFDFWIRSSRNYRYFYLPEPLVKKRFLEYSYGQRQYERGSAQLISTFIVCEKALSLCRDKLERRALGKRIRYEMRRALQLGEFGLIKKYFRLWRKIP
jgi:glycosyltransferase involved in cell wall biosynthesis